MSKKALKCLDKTTYLVIFEDRKHKLYYCSIKNLPNRHAIRYNNIYMLDIKSEKPEGFIVSGYTEQIMLAFFILNTTWLSTVGEGLPIPLSTEKIVHNVLDYSGISELIKLKNNRYGFV